LYRDVNMTEKQMPLRTIRLAQGRSLRDVARLAGVSPGELSEVERGRRDPSARTLRAICAALGLKTAVKLLDSLVPERPSKS